MRLATRRGRLAALAVLGVLGIAVTGCASTTSEGASGHATANADLGSPNKATGTPVKIGVIGDAEPGAAAQGMQISGAEAAAKYVNEYRGGLNGHVIEIDGCSTNETPSTATACGVKFVKDGVVAAIVPTSGQDSAVHKALEGSGIPYVTGITADQAILGDPKSFILSNPLGIGTGALEIAKAAGVKRAAAVVVDVPAATGPVVALSKPLYGGAGVAFDLVPVSMQVADPTPQVQQAISKGVGQFSIFGDSAFVTTVIRSLKQLGFKGPIITQITNFPSDQVAAIPGGLKGVTTLSNVGRGKSVERSVYETVMSKYGDHIDVESDFPQSSYQDLLAVVSAVGLTPDAGADASSVLGALTHMPKQVGLPLGGGLQLQCGANRVIVLRSVCVGQVLENNLDTDGSVLEQKIL